MPTSVDIKNLKINKLTEAQYDTAVQGGVIGENELSVLTDLDDAIQVTALPTAGAGEVGKVYQFIGTTDANYTHGYFYECVSDGQTPATYSWTRVDVQPGSSLPSQTGNSGKFLTTDGTDASWGNALALDSDGYIPVVSGQSNVIKMYNNDGLYGGNLLTLFDRSGGTTKNRFNLSYFRSWATSSDRGAAGFTFFYAMSQVAALYITGKGLVAYKGNGSLSSTFDLGESNHMFDTTFTKKLNNGSAIDVPNVAGEMAVKSVNTTITLASADWSSNSQTVTVNGITTTGVVLVSPDPADQSAYTGAGIICTAQAANSLTFTCTSVPSGDIVVNVVQL